MQIQILSQVINSSIGCYGNWETIEENVCFLVHAKIFCAKRKYTSLYIMLKLKCQGVQLWPYFLCMMQVDREKPVIARNCNFRHIFFNFWVKLLKLGVSKQNLSIIVALYSFQQTIWYIDTKNWSYNKNILLSLRGRHIRKSDFEKNAFKSQPNLEYVNSRRYGVEIWTLIGNFVSSSKLYLIISISCHINI